MIKVLVVDDQGTTRQGLRLRLELEPDMDVVGEAGDGREALDLAMALRPDVVLMDAHMPRMDGITTTMALRLVAPDLPVVIHSLDDAPDYRERALAAGAVAFVAKRGGGGTLLQALRHAVGAPKGSPEDVPGA